MSTTKELLNYIIKEKAHGNTFQEMNIQMKIMMKGINVKGILEDRIPDSHNLNEKLFEIAKEFEVNLGMMTG